MYLFIAIIFIAELILFGFIVYWLIKLNRRVNSTIGQISCGKDKINTGFKEFRRVLKSAQDVTGNTIMFIIEKKNQLRNKIIHLALIYLIIVLFKTRYKKAATILQYAIFVRDFWASIPV